MIDYCLRHIFWVCLAPFEYCSAVWCFAAHTHVKLLDRVVNGVNFFTQCVFD